jgi:hypothetical protein
MKFLAVAIFSLIPLFALIFTRFAMAADVLLSWTPPDDPRVVGYVVHWGPASGQYTHSSRAKGDILFRDDTQYAVRGLSDAAPTYFAVVSVDAAGRASGFSNEAARPAITSPSSGFSARFGPCACTPVSGTAAAESAVRLFADNRLVGETFADGTGNWSASVDLTAAGSGAVDLFAESTGVTSERVAGEALPRNTLLPGDLDGDDRLGLGDAIVALQLLTGGPSCGLVPACEVTGDGRIGLPDAVYLLQRAANLR